MDRGTNRGLAVAMVNAKAKCRAIAQAAQQANVRTPYISTPPLSPPDEPDDRAALAQSKADDEQRERRVATQKAQATRDEFRRQQAQSKTEGKSAEEAEEEEEEGKDGGSAVEFDWDAESSDESESEYGEDEDEDEGKWDGSDSDSDSDFDEGNFDASAMSDNLLQALGLGSKTSAVDTGAWVAPSASGLDNSSALVGPGGQVSSGTHWNSDLL